MATMCTITPNDFDRTTLEAVALAYRRVMRETGADLPAYRAALAVYRGRHPEVAEGDAGDAVAGMIAVAAQASSPRSWRLMNG